MKPDAYAHALWQLTENGLTVKEAVTKVKDALEARKRSALFPQVLRAFKRLAEREIRRTRTVLRVANRDDEKTARVQSNATDAELVVDGHLVGGWRLEDREELVDASYKKHLLSLYNQATQ
jgi:hypothetical protein